MPRPTVNNIRSVGDYATLINWNVSWIGNPPSAVSGFMTSDDFNIRCESTDVPRTSSQSTEIWVRGNRVKQPGLFVPSGTINLLLNEGIDNKVSLMIKGWRDACWDQGTGVANRKKDVEGQLKMVRLDRQDNEIWQYMCFGVFLEDYDPTGGQLGNQSADIIRPSMTLSFDYYTDSAISAGA